ncbi:hypothetical protein AB0F52_20520 [Amycolatopsis sp. NPDC024027]|uniref:hypothetical protein n=1 Tax=Amycolatopsis sp. NPDC024027 TaxID=3154327 RepID=UPI0033CAAE00
MAGETDILPLPAAPGRLALGEAKHAYLLGGAQGAFTVVDERGPTVREDRTGASLGTWNARYPAVSDLDLSTLERPGTYRAEASGTSTASRRTSDRTATLDAETKFTSNTAYSPAELGFALREDPDLVLAKEVRPGLDWLDKVWDGRTRTLYAQAGIGTASEEFGFLGDHDVRRPRRSRSAHRCRPTGTRGATQPAPAADLRRQLDSGVASAKASPFGTGVDVTDFDAAGKSFAATARLYERVTGDRRYAALGARQRRGRLRRPAVRGGRPAVHPSV